MNIFKIILLLAFFLMFVMNWKVQVDIRRFFVLAVAIICFMVCVVLA